MEFKQQPDRNKNPQDHWLFDDDDWRDLQEKVSKDKPKRSKNFNLR